MADLRKLIRVAVAWLVLGVAGVFVLHAMGVVNYKDILFALKGALP